MGTKAASPAAEPAETLQVSENLYKESNTTPESNIVAEVEKENAEISQEENE